MRVRLFMLLAVCFLVGTPVLAQDAEIEAVAAADAAESAPSDAESLEVAVAPADVAPAEDDSSEVAIPEEPSTPIAPTVDETPSTPQQVVDAGKGVWDAVKTGKTALIGAAIVFLVMLLLRLPMLGGLTGKIPQRWRIVMVILLSAAYGAFNAVALGTAWSEAMYAALFTAPNAVFANELFVESILGKRYKKEEPAAEKKPS